MIFYIPSSLAENSENASWKNTSLKEDCTSTKKYISSFFLYPLLRESNIAIIKFLKIRIYCRTRASSNVIWGVPLHKREFQWAILDWFYYKDECDWCMSIGNRRSRIRNPNHDSGGWLDSDWFFWRYLKK